MRRHPAVGGDRLPGRRRLAPAPRRDGRPGVGPRPTLRRRRRAAGARGRARRAHRELDRVAGALRGRRPGRGRGRAGSRGAGRARPRRPGPAAPGARLLRPSPPRGDRRMAVRAPALPALGRRRSSRGRHSPGTAVHRRGHARRPPGPARSRRRRDRGARRGGSARVTGGLADLRVLEVTDESGDLAGRLLAGMGAEVVKLEPPGPPGGSPSRRIGPFYRDDPHPDRSLHFWHYNVGKRAASVDLTRPEGRALLERLAAAASVVIAAGAPAELEARGLLDGERLRRANPRLILVTITPFGLDGPWRDRPATDLTLMALGGSMAACGYGPGPGGVYATPPLTCAGWQAYQTACVYALPGLLGAVILPCRPAPGVPVGADPDAGREPRRSSPPRSRLLGPRAPSRARPGVPLRRRTVHRAGLPVALRATPTTPRGTHGRGARRGRHRPRRAARAPRGGPAGGTPR